MAEFGCEVEVIDARSVRPLDIDTIVSSVKRTGVLIIADTGWKFGGISGEVIAAVSEDNFAYLKKAPLRISLPDLPAPTSPYLTKKYYPDACDIASNIARHLHLKVSVAELNARLERKTPHDVPQLDFTGPF